MKSSLHLRIELPGSRYDTYGGGATGAHISVSGSLKALISCGHTPRVQNPCVEYCAMQLDDQDMVVIMKV